MRTLSIFDLDGTLLTVNSSYRFGAYLYQKGVIPFSKMLYLMGCYIRHKMMGMSLSDLHDAVFTSIFEGKSIEIFLSHIDGFLDKIMDRSCYIPAIKRLREAQHKKHHVYMLSNSPSFLVENVARRLGIERWRSTTYLVDEAGIFRSIERVWEGSDKAAFVNMIAAEGTIARGDIIAYSDSILDLPLLESAGTAVGVNPDRALRKECVLRGWEIL